MIKNNIYWIVKTCGRDYCRCKDRSVSLALKIPISKEDEKNITKEIDELKISYKDCYGSYKSILKNLEWENNTY